MNIYLAKYSGISTCIWTILGVNQTMLNLKFNGFSRTICEKKVIVNCALLMCFVL